MAAAMNELGSRLRAALWWLAPLLVATALIAWETDLGRAIRKLPAPEEPIAARPVITSLLPEYTIAGGTAARPDTVARTVFNPTRRPAPVALAEQAKPRLQRGQFALTGTMVIGGKNTAFLREMAGGKSRRVLQGDTVNGILVAEVKADRVRLALGDESEELVLRVVTNPRPTVQPAAPAATPAAAPPPTAAAVPAVAADSAGTAAGTAADASLAERRRAARAAQAAVQAQTSTPDGNPIPTPAPAPVQSAPAAAAVAAPATPPDPRWADMYRAYQQPRTPNPPR